MAALLGHIDILPFIYVICMVYAFVHLAGHLKTMRLHAFALEAGLLWLAFSMHGGHVATGIAVMLMPPIVTSLVLPRRKHESGTTHSSN